MKLLVKTLKGARFEIEVNLEDKVGDVKKHIESVHGSDVYPAARQMLIHKGKVLEDATTLQQNEVSEDSFMVIMLSKNKSSSTIQVVAEAPPPQPPSSTTNPPSNNPYNQAASHLVEGINLPGTSHSIILMDEEDTCPLEIIHGILRVALNNPESDDEFLYSGIPDSPDLPPVAAAPPQPPVNPPQATQPPPPAPPTGPSANPLNLFSQGLPADGGGNLDSLLNDPELHAYRSEPLYQSLGRQYPQPHIRRLIHNDFMRLIYGPVEEAGDGRGQRASGVSEPFVVTRADTDALDRLEAMGFNNLVVWSVYFACDKNEELAANYLLDHMHEFEEP